MAISQFDVRTQTRGPSSLVRAEGVVFSNSSWRSPRADASDKPTPSGVAPVARI